MQSRIDNKTNDNCKGLTLVELIVAIAIMAVLMIVLTPQFTKHIEETKLQKDNATISEIASVMKMQTQTTEPVGQGTYTGYYSVCSFVRYPGEDHFHIWLEPSPTLIDEFRDYFLTMHDPLGILTAVDPEMLEHCATNSYEIAEMVYDLELTSSSYQTLPWQTDHLGTFQEVLLVSIRYNGQDIIYMPSYISEVGGTPQVYIFE